MYPSCQAVCCSSQRETHPDPTHIYTNHANHKQQAALALAAANPQQQPQQPQQAAPATDAAALPSETKLLRAAEEASVRDMVVDRTVGVLLESFRGHSRTDPRRLLGVVTEGIYYSPAMAGLGYEEGA
jgi:hypothetical protein